MAARKVEKLLPFGPRLICIAPVICARIESLAQGRISLRSYTGSLQGRDMEGACFVIAATDQGKTVKCLGGAVVQERQIPVNVVDDKGKCTFFFPALVQEGALTVGISSDGKCPAAASFIRKKWRRNYRRDWGIP